MHLGAPGLRENRGSCAGGGEVGPTSTRVTDRRANCGRAFSTNHGGHCRRVQNATTGPIFGKDL